MKEYLQDKIKKCKNIDIFDENYIDGLDITTAKERNIRSASYQLFDKKKGHLGIRSNINFMQYGDIVEIRDFEAFIKGKCFGINLLTEFLQDIDKNCSITLLEAQPKDLKNLNNDEITKKIDKLVEFYKLFDFNPIGTRIIHGEFSYQQMRREKKC